MSKKSLTKNVTHLKVVLKHVVLNKDYDAFVR